MSHLGERVSALVDGELNHTERDRALAHLTFCADCRREVESVRALKSRLRSLETPAMPADLTMSLLRMAEPGGPLPPRERPFPTRTFGECPSPGRTPSPRWTTARAGTPLVGPRALVAVVAGGARRTWPSAWSRRPWRSAPSSPPPA
ncbi:anti-sigma factor family protein [Nonomuraea rubra]|uniref:anti-sigma factor family protein n=1 Tax=Nonomuraea rubra TaxID=46180 RepID=UPI00360BB3D8